MPMIDTYAAAGTFADVHKLAADAAALIKGVERVPDIPMFRRNTAAFVREMPAAAVANIDGDAQYVRVKVLTNGGALDRDKQLALVKELTDLVAAAANNPELKTRTWVLLTEAAPGGWSLWGHAQLKMPDSHQSRRAAEGRFVARWGGIAGPVPGSVVSKGARRS